MLINECDIRAESWILVGFRSYFTIVEKFFLKKVKGKSRLNIAENDKTMNQNIFKDNLRTSIWTWNEWIMYNGRGE